MHTVDSIEPTLERLLDDLERFYAARLHSDGGELAEACRRVQEGLGVLGQVHQQAAEQVAVLASVLEAAARPSAPRPQERWSDWPGSSGRIAQLESQVEELELRLAAAWSAREEAEAALAAHEAMSEVEADSEADAVEAAPAAHEAMSEVEVDSEADAVEAAPEALAAVEATSEVEVDSEADAVEAAPAAHEATPEVEVDSEVVAPEPRSEAEALALGREDWDRLQRALSRARAEAEGVGLVVRSLEAERAELWEAVHGAEAALDGAQVRLAELELELAGAEQRIRAAEAERGVERARAMEAELGESGARFAGEGLEARLLELLVGSRAGFDEADEAEEVVLAAGERSDEAQGKPAELAEDDSPSPGSSHRREQRESR